MPKTKGHAHAIDHPLTRPSRLPPERDRVRRDSGYSLTEMLVATVLMGTVILAIVGGMWAVVRSVTPERRASQDPSGARRSG